MRFTVITHVTHKSHQDQIYGYGPYIREMNLWLSHADETEVVAPMISAQPDAIDLAYTKPVKMTIVPAFNLTGISEIVKTILRLPMLCYRIFSAMRKSDHIHLRCPGNMGLLGALIQIFFPSTPKTAKYAGNWDPKAKQPLSYRLQRAILANTFLTRNMTVLVYGDFNDSSKNVKPFFTATYREADKIPAEPRSLSGDIRFVFAGSLVSGKRPGYAIDMVIGLRKEGIPATLGLFGDGALRDELERYVATKNANSFIVFHGNKQESELRKAYQNSHFLILASKSEGWPKVVAEAMFWGCVPIGTAVSCVPYMLGNGDRGILLGLDPETDVRAIVALLENPTQYEALSLNSVSWSRQFTLDLFDSQIAHLMQE